MTLSTPVLVGDIGGTNMRFAVVVPCDGHYQINNFWTSANDHYTAFEEGLKAYIQSLKSSIPQKAVIAVAGFVKDNNVTLTNRDWTFTGNQLQALFGFQNVKLVNDFAAMARCVPQLQSHQMECLIDNPVDLKAPITVAGAGTGFGLATLVPNGNDWIVIGGEGGHQSYAPKTLLEIELLQTLQSEYAHVSVEIVVGGKFAPSVLKALYDIYGLARQELTPQQVLEKAKQGDEICLTLCQVRSRAIMSACGDAVLQTGSGGGLVLAGGVTEHLMSYVNTPESLAYFLDKEPLSPFMNTIRVSMIRCDTAPLIGAAFL